MPDRDESSTDLPADWIDALRRGDRAPAVVTRAVDRALGDAAEAQFADRRARPAWRRPAGWAALAASLAVMEWRRRTGQYVSESTSFLHKFRLERPNIVPGPANEGGQMP